MAYDEDNAIVLWPEYFDVKRSRAEGRKLPINLCVEDPDIDIIAKGAMLLDLEYQIDEKACYPANWAMKRGCVRVEKGKMKKTQILPKIGEILVKNKQ